MRVSIVFYLQIVFEVHIKNERRLDNEGNNNWKKSRQGHRKKTQEFFLLCKQF